MFINALEKLGPKPIREKAVQKFPGELLLHQEVLAHAQYLPDLVIKEATTSFLLTALHIAQHGNGTPASPIVLIARNVGLSSGEGYFSVSIDWLTVPVNLQIRCSHVQRRTGNVQHLLPMHMSAKTRDLENSG